jgi:hypothetical protein
MFCMALAITEVHTPIAEQSRPSKLRTRDLNNMKSSFVLLKLLWSVLLSALIFYNTLNLFIHKVLFFNYVPFDSFGSNHLLLHRQQ